MKNQKIVIIDTGCANASSLGFAIERLGYKAQISTDSKTILRADKVFLPGVGTAKEAMHNLFTNNLVDLICDLKQPVLGICLGMQLLGSISDENNLNTPCFNIVDSRIKLLNTHGLPLPHMGWHNVYFQAGHPLFADIPEETYFYFVHSYGMEVNDNTVAECHYGDTFSAAVQQDNFFGVQFHPERSGLYGAKLIKNFLDMPKG